MLTPTATDGHGGEDWFTKEGKYSKKTLKCWNVKYIFVLVLIGSMIGVKQVVEKPEVADASIPLRYGP